MLRRLLDGDRARTLLLGIGAVAVVALLIQAFPRPPAPRPLPAVTPAATRTPAATAAPPPTRSTAAAVTPQPHQPAGPIDLNTATKDELLALPGIGDVRAQRILESRATDGPFAAPADLVARNIIPQGVFNQMKDLVTVERATAEGGQK